MNDLLLSMSSDMGIYRFDGEMEDNFIYRLCYSALGQWCLHIAKNFTDGVAGTTKHNQTNILNDLIMRFSELFPFLSDRFIDSSNCQITLPVHIRRVYEETGYLITNENKRNQIANYGRSISFGNSALFFGIPSTVYTINGLGTFTRSTEYNVSSREFLIRDDLTYEEYFKTQFDTIDFYQRDIDINELEFFNPISNDVPSQSWKRHMETDCTVARKSETGPFYRVMRTSGVLQFADEPIEQQSDKFTSYEYRRLYFALKSHYKNPIKAIITKVDKEYSKIRMRGRLPNREYYYLLLLSWPLYNAFDKINFLIRNELLPEVCDILTNIGVEIKGERSDA